MYPTKQMLITAIILVMSITTFGQAATKSSNDIAKIEVVYFHATNRCLACQANETLTKKVVEKRFRKEIRKGIVSFISLDLSEAKNQVIVDKYRIEFPTLLILKKLGNSEIITNYTDTAFEFALSNPKKYKALLHEEIVSQLGK